MPEIKKKFVSLEECVGFRGLPWAAGIHVFLALDDTPASYAGKAKYVVRVNAGETGLEFKKFEYDADYKCYVIEE